jgi:hypothetical protein
MKVDKVVIKSAQRLREKFAGGLKRANMRQMGGVKTCRRGAEEGFEKFGSKFNL